MRVGIVGLGRMGANMAGRLREHGIEATGYDRDPETSDVDSLEALVADLDGQERRILWSMVPAGGPTEETLNTLAELVDPGDLLVDGANSNYRESQRRGHQLSEAGIGFVDAGVSGGIWGRKEGYCLMVGGSSDDVDTLEPVLAALAPESGYAHLGPVGAGHFTKMVHNGIEYGLMQAYAEGYELLAASDIDIDLPATAEVWRHGSVVRSWLLDLLADALAKDPELASVKGWAEDSGEGRWTVQEAIEHAVPVPAISSALYARFASRQDDSPAMRAIAILRNQFGGHEVQR